MRSEGGPCPLSLSRHDIIEILESAAVLPITCSPLSPPTSSNLGMLLGRGQLWYHFKNVPMMAFNDVTSIVCTTYFVFRLHSTQVPGCFFHPSF